MKGRVWLTALVLLCITLGSTAFAEQVAEVWRYPWAGIGDIAASAADGSVWVTNQDTGSVLRLAPDLSGGLQEEVRVSGIPGPRAIAVNSADGSCWVGSSVLGEVVHVAADGTELSRTAGIAQPLGLSVDSVDGSCWVAEGPGCYIIHLAADGAELSRRYYSGITGAIAAVPGTNSCWFGECFSDQIHHLRDNLDGTTTILSTSPSYGEVTAISVDSGDGTIWLADCIGGAVVRLRENLDYTISTLCATYLTAPQSLSAIPGAGVWVVEHCPGGFNPQPYVRHLDASGVVDTTITGIAHASVVSADDSNASCWVLAGGELVHLGAAGDELEQALLLRGPAAVAASPVDGSSWVVDGMGGEVVHITAGGEVVASPVAFDEPMSVAVDPGDGTVWVGDRHGGTGANEVVHLAADGSELFRTGGFCCPRSLAVDPNDHSCWVANGGPDASVVQLAADDGDPTVTLFLGDPTAVGVDPNDSSVWVGVGGTAVLGLAPAIAPPPSSPSIVHLTWTGELLSLASRVEVGAPATSLAVDPFDSSCVAVVEGGRVVLSAAGDPVSRDGVYQYPVYRVTETEAGPSITMLGSFIAPMGVSVSPLDRSIWVADQYQVGHMSADGTVLSRSGEYFGVRSVSVDASTGACWVAGSGGFLAIDFLVGAAPLPGPGGPGTVALLAVVPEADFAASANNGAAPFEVSFTDLSTGYPSAWEWDFGDGSTSAEQNPTHTYAAGLYTVSLTIEGAGGSDTETKINYIHAAVAPAVAFSADVTRGASPLAVQFTDESEVAATSWLWSFGDGGTSTAQNPAHTYEGPAFYAVTLTVGVEGLAASVTKSAYIAVGFADTPGDHWALLQEIACAEAGIVQGYSDGRYDPAGLVNRAQMATYIARALAGGDGNVPSGPATATFTDVGLDHWAYRYIEYCADHDIVTGYSDGSYQPDGTVNRGQMAVFIARAAASPEGMEDYVPPTAATFSDVTSANEWAWCHKYVEYVVSLDPPVVQGYLDGTYHPEYNVSRDQMAVYMQRAFGLPIPSSTP
jgi:PKD repeat protein